jgi:hypothetical protein
MCGSSPLSARDSLCTRRKMLTDTSTLHVEALYTIALGLSFIFKSAASSAFDSVIFIFVTTRSSASSTSRMQRRQTVELI